MLVAALDTATLTLSCALCEVDGADVRVLSERIEQAPSKPGPQGPTGGHGGRLPGALNDLLVSLGRKLGDVQAYAIGLGPGSFTGLRIGLATWKGLAYAHKRPIAGASSLGAMALGAAGSAAQGDLLIPLLDAKKGELYAGFYRVTGAGVEAAAPDAALPPEALVARIAALQGEGARPRVFGDGLGSYASVLAGAPVLSTDVKTPPAGGVARLCAAALSTAAYDAMALYALEPHYVRPSEAELKFPNGNVPGAGKP